MVGTCDFDTKDKNWTIPLIFDGEYFDTKDQTHAQIISSLEEIKLLLLNHIKGEK